MDLFTKRAEHCKRVTKLSYMTMMALGSIISVVTTIYLNQSCSEKEFLDEKSLQSIVVGLSLLTSLWTGVVTFLNPQQKWQQLRGAALAIESEVWKFRTRTGVYTTHQITTSGGFSTEAEENLQTFLEDMKDHVLKSASILETSMFAALDVFDNPTNPSRFNHGQYEGSGVHGTFASEEVNPGLSSDAFDKNRDPQDVDDFHSPLKPSQFFHLRLKPRAKNQTKRPSLGSDI